MMELPSPSEWEYIPASKVAARAPWSRGRWYHSRLHVARSVSSARRRLVPAAVRGADAGPGARLGGDRLGAERAADGADGVGEDTRRVPVVRGPAGAGRARGAPPGRG